MKKFEYKLMTNDQRHVDSKDLDEFLNEVGQEGWELVDYQMMDWGTQHMIFKREIIE